ncbi:MAG: M23 family metallopeptidase [Proteobacteria bacterium]|nr:M23 family metallopeptidase [Pseudomonadota bacterium]HQR04358.1 M23 family metallopeptidase [Rhodocyclaceae bacterium]
MHIILVSNRLATAKTIALTPRRLLTAVALTLCCIMAVSSLISYLAMRHAAEVRLPFLQSLLRVVSAEESERSREYLKAMAVRLGEMQAQIIRLDSLGERLSRVAGVSTEPVTKRSDGQGGPLVLDSAINPQELQQALDELGRKVEFRTDNLSSIESRIFEERMRKHLIPTSLPLDTPWNASTFGWRADPFTGERAMHEGVDFSAEQGTVIKAAAAGIVVTAGYRPDYGNMVEIDHGNDLTTRYGHASKVLVEPGSLVKRGQPIALVGSTGRSTGPHLHFEVRYKGVAQNPNRFLEQARTSSLAAR